MLRTGVRACPPTHIITGLEPFLYSRGSPAWLRTHMRLPRARCYRAKGLCVKAPAAIPTMSVCPCAPSLRPQRSAASLSRAAPAAARYNYFWRQGTVRVQAVMLTGGSLYGVYLMMAKEAQR